MSPNCVRVKDCITIHKINVTTSAHVHSKTKQKKMILLSTCQSFRKKISIWINLNDNISILLFDWDHQGVSHSKIYTQLFKQAWEETWNTENMLQPSTHSNLMESFLSKKKKKYTLSTSTFSLKLWTCALAELGMRLIAGLFVIFFFNYCDLVSAKEENMCKYVYPAFCVHLCELYSVLMWICTEHFLSGV